jgi:hypothetical protein
MEAITLPVLPGETPLHIAITVMRGARVTGVVTPRGDQCRLVRAGDLYHAARSGEKTIAESRSTEIATAGVLQFTPDVPRERRFGETGFTNVDSWSGVQPKADYTLVQLGIGIATIVTASEEYAGLLGGELAECYCVGPRQHPYGKTHPQVCKHDQTAIECEPT